MSDTTYLIGAILALAGAILAPVVLAYFTGRQRHAEKIEDWKRQDAVAASLRAANKTIANVAEESTRMIAAASEATNKKLDEIHTLVDGNLTASMQAELEATQRELAMMSEVIVLKKVAGQEPSPDTLATLERTKERVAELQQQLASRRKMEEELK